MAAELITRPMEGYSGGITSTFNSVDEARDQALADIRADRVPAPDRIVEDGNIVIDRAGLEKLARS